MAVDVYHVSSGYFWSHDGVMVGPFASVEDAIANWTAWRNKP